MTVMGEWMTVKGFAEMLDGFGRIAPLTGDYVQGVTLDIVTKPDPNVVASMVMWAHGVRAEQWRAEDEIERTMNAHPIR